MLIVSQDGKCMTEDLNIYIKSRNQKIDEVIYAIENDEFILGYYKTEKRAKEVLTEIIQSYIDSENYKYVNGLMKTEELNRLQKGLVYGMPKE